MFDRILVPLDGSPRAEQVLDLLAPLLQRKDSEVLLVRSVHVPPLAAEVDLAAVEAQARAEATKYAADVTARLEARGILVRSSTTYGPAAEAILETADRERADLIAMTTHGRTGFARWALGSVAEKVVRGASMPVFLARSFRSEEGGKTAAAMKGPIRKILVPTDGSASSRAVVSAAAEWARLFESEIVVLYSGPGKDMPPGAYYGTMVDPLGPAYIPPPTTQEVEGVVRKAALSFSKKGVRVTTLTVAGDPAAQIVDTAAARGVDLIAMATHGRSGLSRWVLGSVTEKVLRNSTVPMLIVRATAEPREAGAGERVGRKRKVAKGTRARRGLSRRR